VRKRPCARRKSRRQSKSMRYGRKSERAASTRTRTSSLGARSSASQATARRTGGAETNTSDSIELERRNKGHGTPGGTGHLMACPLAGGASSWLGWVTARRRGGRAWVGLSPPHRQDRASSFRRYPWVCECVCRSGPKLGVEEKKISELSLSILDLPHPTNTP
jgi:hypothetical protein